MEEIVPAPNLKDASTVAKIIHSSLKDFAVAPNDLTGPFEGMDNVAWRSTSGYIFRFAKDHETSEQNKREIQILPILQKYLTLAVPVPELNGNQPNGLCFMGYREIEGIPFSPELTSGLTPSEKEGAVESLATFLKELRSFPASVARSSGINERNLMDFFLKVRRDYQTGHTSTFTLEENNKIQAAFENYLKNPENFSYTPALVHADLSPDHILFDSNSRKISGVIDWSDMHITDPVFELQRLCQNYGEAFTREILQKTGVDSDLELQRASFFTIARNLQRYMRLLGKDDIRAGIMLSRVRHELAKK